MMTIVAIAGGGAIGAVLRYVAAGWVYDQLGRAFPYGTLAVNVTGSLIMGLLFVWLTERMAVAPEWRAFLLVGLLGAFTTFSTFSIETLQLLQDGAWLRAMANMVVSVVLCVGAAWTGVLIGRM